MARLPAVLFVGAALLAPQQQTPTFRAGTILVPIDARAVDRGGSPVRDLRREDFVVLENGVQQDVAHFSTHEYEGGSSRDSSAPLTDDAQPAELDAPSHRTFVFVLGRGRLRGPSEGMKALTDFVRTRVRPEDRLAVVAYDRITHITSDRDAITRLLDLYAARHEELEALFDHWFHGPLSTYAGIDAPPHLQRRIDSLFDAPGLPPMRHLLSMPPEVKGHLEFDRRTALDADADGTSDLVAFASAAQDLEKLHATIDYLRLLDGEKHVIFLTEEGLHGPRRAEYGQTLARLAADARVTVSTIHTGGLPLTWRLPRGRDTQMWVEGPTWEQRSAYADSRYLAQRTGRLASVFSYAARALDRVERSTRFTYLLGYYPKAATWDGRPRRIEVKVTRKDVTVLHRHEYYARRIRARTTTAHS